MKKVLQLKTVNFKEHTHKDYNAKLKIMNHFNFLIILVWFGK